MCGPLVAATAALTAASVIANKVGSDQAQGAHDSAVSTENARQRQFMQQSNDKFNETLPGASMPAQLASADSYAAMRRSASDAVLNTGGGDFKAPTGSNTDNAGGGSIARAVGASLDRGKQQAVANAAVGGVGDARQNLGINLSHSGDWQSIFAGNMARSSAILPLELQDAQRQGSTARGIGSILGSAAQATGSAAIGTPGGGSWSEIYNGGGPLTDGSFGPKAPGLLNRVFS